jgi:hypothetical protein
MWRGTTTGSDDINNNIRYKIVSKNYNIHPEIDIGFSSFVQAVYESNKTKFELLKKPNVSIDDQYNSKFILCIEGNDWASSFPWALASNCCPLHNYPFSYDSYIFGKGLKPYVHFVPVDNDGSNLLEQYNWCLNNMSECETIANNGKQYMQQYLDSGLFEKVMQTFVESYSIK